MVIAVSKCEGADENSALALDHHRLPEGGRIHRSLDAVPRRLGFVDTHGIQLRQGGDVTGRSVDEELAHGPRR